jgi:hypothetical protein
MRTTEKEIVRGVLGRMGDEAPEPVPFQDLHTVLVQPGDTQRNTWWMRRPVWITAAVAVVVLVLGVGPMLLSNNQTGDVYVADGERLISADPPIVQGAESPEPAFDTSGLGDEVALTPVTDTSRILETATGTLGDYPSELVRITVLGETPEWVLAVVVHNEVGPDFGGRMQLRCLTASLGGATCEGVEFEDLGDMPGGLLPADPDSGPVYSVGERISNAILTWEVPAETSVVTLTVNGQTRWQRPVAQVAVFITDLTSGERFELTAYDSQGSILNLFRDVASLIDPNG